MIMQTTCSDHVLKSLDLVYSRGLSCGTGAMCNMHINVSVRP